MSEQVSMTRYRKSGEIVRPFVYLLHERRLCIYVAGFSQNPMNLPHHELRVQYVLEDRLDPDTIKRAIGERKIVRISDIVDGVARVNIDADTRQVLVLP